MNGYTSIVTGANSGIGLETARALSARGDQVFLVCRSPEKAMAAAAEIAVPGGAEPIAIIADLSSQVQVLRAAQEIRDRCDSIDVLVNNAGAYFPHRTESEEGLEMNFALNHLAYFRLTQELIGLLGKARQSRVINVASRAHRMGKLNFDDLEYKKRRYGAYVAYGTSKLMNILFTRALVKRLDPKRVTANSLHPGVVRTGFGHDYPGLFSWLATLARPAMVSAEKGAETSIHLAMSREVEGVTGAYFAEMRRTTPRKKALDDAASERLWRISEEVCGIR